MSKIYNIYCDESCYLQNDISRVMVIGAIWCPKSQVKEINNDLRLIKTEHGFPVTFETKWIKVSPAQLVFYQELVNYFFSNNHLHFRALIVPDKSKLRHEDYNQTHDDWYYKMYFDMLKIIFDPENQYQIYVDIKDTRSAIKVAKLHDVLCNNLFDFSRDIIEKVQIVRSNEIEIMQLTDLFIGAICYANRGLTTSQAKLSLIELIRRKSGYKLTEKTLFRADKINLFKWNAQENG
ncbi:hypothetical protein ADN00_10520 [Ornatilinea apprima]|uniref:DUF3800 domain-containing protein n=1 Tax=Ornatilinea apprima TaxID=1134406 RepID=A0A0P6X582_9CHLR|nr:DUF3800 domain-containing protein [Ornatilinea apprima]KPL76997.1 hypothetical protein ADN00_10520 [Ornatilinea apprima]